jgi:hypothetical protein
MQQDQLRNAPKEYKRIFESIRRKAKKCKVELRFGLASVVSLHETDLDGFGGYFYNQRKGRFNGELAVAIGGKKGGVRAWMKNFIHESCHMDQYFDKRLREKNDEWGEAYRIFEEYLFDKKRKADSTLFKAIQLIIECELDCEKRSLAKIKKYGLNVIADKKYRVNTTTYIREANAYFFTYLYLYYFGAWADYCTKADVRRTVPNRFLDEYVVLPQQYIKAIERRLQSKQLAA